MAYKNQLALTTTTPGQRNNMLKCLGTGEEPDVCLKMMHFGENSGFDDEGGQHDLIKSCAILSNALGICKSFSMSDISQLPAPDSNQPQLGKKSFVSEIHLNSGHQWVNFGHPFPLNLTSRSCSTWVAVGELSSTSQLPSPQGSHSINSLQFSTNTLPISSTSPIPPLFTASDLIKSVNKNIRETYIRKRLMTTYRALERLSQSSFNLDQLAAAANKHQQHKSPGPTQLIVPTMVLSADKPRSKNQVPATVTISDNERTVSRIAVQNLKENLNINLDKKSLTISDVERDRGKSISKYERNMMIFNWLHSLDSNCAVDETNN